MRRARWLVGSIGALGLATVGLVAAVPPSVGASPSCTGTTTVTCAFSFTGAPDSFTVPAGVTQITVNASGAQAGGTFASGAGGQGARLVASFAVTPGETLNVLVGGRGTDSQFAGGGGGGSFVYRTSTSGGLLIAAAGGGGAGSNAGIPGSATSTAANGEASGSGTGGTVGTMGNGGGGGTGVLESGAGGGGLLTNGGNGGSTATGGKALANGGAGGTGGTADGGFGGGGAGDWEHTTVSGGGGGGGFNGGGGGAGELGGPGSGGGGGSFSATTPSLSQSGVQTGDGTITITYTLPTTPPAPPVLVTPRFTG